MSAKFQADRHPTFLIFFAAAAVYFLFVPLSGRFYTDFHPHDFIILHSVSEAVSIVIAFMCFGITFHSHRMSRNTQNLFLGIAFLSIGIIDIFHTLSYNGMPDFITPNTVNKATQLWITARLIGAAAFFAAVFVRPDAGSALLRPYPMLAVGLILPAVVLYLLVFHPYIFPDMFVPGHGLTPLKIRLEYSVAGLQAVTAALIYRQFRKDGQAHLVYFIGALLLGVFSELLFTLYASPYDIYNLMGHVYKVGSYLLIYMMLFVTSIEEPYNELSNAKEVLREYTYNLEDMVMERTNALNEKNSELTELNRLKNDLLAVCSHDMKTPIQTNTLLAELMLEGVDGPLTEPQREAIEVIRKNDQELNELITNLIDLARKEQGDITLNTEPVDLAQMLKGWASKHETLAKKKGVRFSVDVGVNSHPIIAEIDRFKIKQTLNNLLSNAFKYTPEGGNIRLTVSQAHREDWLWFSMFNTGPAIPKSRLTAIFDKYVQARPGGHPASEGVGLGLNIAKNHVEMHGGRIWAESEEGVGTTIIFTLPPKPPANSGEAQEGTFSGTDADHSTSSSGTGIGDSGYSASAGPL